MFDINKLQEVNKGAEVLAKSFIVENDGEEYFDILGCLKFLKNENVSFQEAIDLSERAKKIYYRDREE